MKNINIKKVCLILFRILSLIIILYCLYLLYNWHNENKKNNTLIESLRSQVDIPNLLNENNDNSSENEITSTEKQEKNLIDFSDLLLKNTDTVAWIKVNNTNIDFPVVKSKDNDYYLTHDFEHNYNSAGWIFADYRNNFDGNDKNIIIYGHNRRDGSMFSNLKKTLTESWYKNPENMKIPLYTLSKNYIYQVFSIYSVSSKESHNKTAFSSNDEFQKYINEIQKKSIYNFNVDVTDQDNILTLYTCGDNTKYRIILHAKLINQ